MINNNCKYIDKPICIIGASGFLGKEISLKLSKEKVNWIGINKSGKNNCVSIDLERDECVEQLVKVFDDCSIVINASGSFKPKDFQMDPDYICIKFRNISENIALALSKSSCIKFINVSSAGAVYGELNKVVDEDDKPSPISHYGLEKLREERLYEKICEINKKEYLCLRVSNPYGNSEFSCHGFIDVAIKSILMNKVLKIYSDKNLPVRNYIHINDFSNIVWEMIKYEKSGLFNIGSNEHFSLIDIIDIINSSLGVGKLNVVRDGLRPIYDVDKSYISIEKLSNSIDYEFSETVESYIVKKIRDSGL